MGQKDLGIHIFLRSIARSYLELKPRNASILAKKWVESGFCELDNPSKRARRYRLTAKFESVIVTASAPLHVGRAKVLYLFCLYESEDRMRPLHKCRRRPSWRLAHR